MTSVSDSDWYATPDYRLTLRKTEERKFLGLQRRWAHCHGEDEWREVPLHNIEEDNERRN